MITLEQQAKIVQAARINRDAMYMLCDGDYTDYNVKAFFEVYKEYYKQMELFVLMHNTKDKYIDLGLGS